MVTAEPLTVVLLRPDAGSLTPGPIMRIPRDSPIHILGASAMLGMTDIEWQGQQYAAFTVDIEERCVSEDAERPGSVRPLRWVER